MRADTELALSGWAGFVSDQYALQECPGHSNGVAETLQMSQISEQR